MSNERTTTRTNYFMVKDEGRFREIIRSISAEDEVTIYEQETNGIRKFGVGCSGPSMACEFWCVKTRIVKT